MMLVRGLVNPLPTIVPAQHAAPDKVTSDIPSGNEDPPRVPELRPFRLRGEIEETVIHFSRRTHRTFRKICFELEITFGCATSNDENKVT